MKEIIFFILVVNILFSMWSSRYYHNQYRREKGEKEYFYGSPRMSNNEFMFIEDKSNSSAKMANKYKMSLIISLLLLVLLGILM